MTGDDICGYEAPNGPCQNPATEGDSCWIESHGGHVNGHGRPSKLEDRWDEIMRGARQGMTLEGCARLAGVAEKTLHQWKNEHDDFRKSLKRARAEGELKHLQSVDDAGSRFVLERSFGYVKTEKREVDASHEHTGEGGGPIQVEFNETTVKTDWVSPEEDDE